jgi:hypothetical protein
MDTFPLACEFYSRDPVAGRPAALEKAEHYAHKAKDGTAGMPPAGAPIGAPVGETRMTGAESLKRH